MFNTFHNLKISGCGIGISMPSGGTGDKFINPEIANCNTAIEYRDPPSLISSLGLPAETPPKVVLEALKILRSHEKQAPEQRVTLLKKSNIGPFLQGAANATTAATNLLALAVSPQLAPAIALLKAAMGKIAG
ncbi:hypothetical protein [Pseudomonas sp. GL-B-16]|uniref:hypothetical protein n=1 Tax=Pseudomonas sp. GL-B-16 TaxID=2832373 RepID=UPI001CBB0CCD|nr:hypothetical protein [Pseudomonas sp. GL-B-16]